MIIALVTLLTAVLAISVDRQAESSQSALPSEVPQIDAGLGPCSVEFMLRQPNEKPAGNAKITVRIAYGFMGVRKLDLEVPTNSDGKARFTGLPDNLKHGLFFHASQGDLEGTGFVDPAKNCKAQHTIVLSHKPAEKENP